MTTTFIIAIVRAMASPFERSASHHPAQQNMHGEVGCVTKDGSVCTACCHFFEVRPLNKPKHTACHHTNCTGCGIHNQPEQPDICRDYHCSRETMILNNPLIADRVIRQIAFERIVGLLETSLRLFQISEDEFHLAYQFWLSAKENVYTLSDEE